MPTTKNTHKVQSGNTEIFIYKNNLDILLRSQGIKESRKDKANGWFSIIGVSELICESLSVIWNADMKACRKPATVIAKCSFLEQMKIKGQTENLMLKEDVRSQRNWKCSTSFEHLTQLHTTASDQWQKPTTDNNPHFCRYTIIIITPHYRIVYGQPRSQTSADLVSGFAPMRSVAEWSMVLS